MTGPFEKEGQEELAQPTEEWVSLDESTVEYLTQNTNPDFESTEDAILWGGRGSNRLEHICGAIALAQLEIASANAVAKKGGTFTAPVGIQVVMRETNPATVYIVMNKLRSLSNQEYRQERDRLIEQANKMLEIFDRPRLPTYKD